MHRVGIINDRDITDVCVCDQLAVLVDHHAFHRQTGIIAAIHGRLAW
ncbi:hypothetical protein ACFOYW_15990 [Gryllotalpicola reticulitermitis]|uniref:Uncharacterized protein n=1 Tax=Gryllotalpicola reticulitermitis TaxID=1184153 RepID=A0ABV8Q957_9MICO